MKQMKNHNFYDNCMLCPRTCGAQRSKGKTGICGVTETLKVARAALHFWEEPTTMPATKNRADSSGNHQPKTGRGRPISSKGITP